MNIEFLSEAPAEGAALVVLSAKDLVLSEAAQRIDEAGDGALRRAAKAARFSGEEGKSVELLAPAGSNASRVILMGTGAQGRGTAYAFEKLGAGIAAQLSRSGTVRAVVDLGGAADLGISKEEAAARIANGIQMRNYAFDGYKTKLPESKKVSLDHVQVVGCGDEAAKIFAELEAINRGVAIAKELVSEPANIIYPESFVERVKGLGIDGLKVDVLTEEQMQEKGMNALLGVSLGSEKEARLLVMEWDGTNGDTEVETVFVGKGVTFDSGGISIKPGAGMEDMKWDMGGAGAVTGAMVALASRKAKVRIVGVCGLVENMPDGKAQRPGDVVKSMSGQTIEVINTDAEGRLVLCDAMWWAQETYKPKRLIDLATLTGAIIIGLGHHHAGVFTNDDDLWSGLDAAGRETGDKVWRLPIGDDYDKQIDSQIADMKNVGGRDAGSITAAQFLGRFVQDGVKWAHIDVAGTVWATKPGPLYDKGATGFGVRLLDEFVRKTCEG
ncbi:leucyl aminopeptidase [Pacificimonas flava]|uniref:Probable cytosol aminopeptidase n=2 Tax=Pacificimonas TaxID=1960290 RepID=A0A219B712_9SPHN|nr:MULTISPECIES: leucyl aminopeptidase [Pacificimonas]MBZ6378554.1 leucyl aminopeptidase [Pacificimonas aurantium]OWV34160.1 leucyl aminopeptidase [Pacificimonas flava]